MEQATNSARPFFLHHVKPYLVNQFFQRSNHSACHRRPIYWNFLLFAKLLRISDKPDIIINAAHIALRTKTVGRITAFRAGSLATRAMHVQKPTINIPERSTEKYNHSIATWIE